MHIFLLVNLGNNYDHYSDNFSSLIVRTLEYHLAGLNLTPVEAN
jgi:hypothetical protein